MGVRAGETTITGTNLWKLSVWGSAVPKNSRNKICFIKQALDDTQMGTPLALNEYLPKDTIGLLVFDNVNVTLDCGESLNTVKYICVKFGKASKGLSDTWYKVVGINNQTMVRQPASLTGCTRLENLKEPNIN